MPTVIDSMSLNKEKYTYSLTEPAGKNFAPGFKPAFTPAEMLSMGVFEGKYINDCKNEYPRNWYTHARISNIPNPELNYFKVKSRTSLSNWRKNNWIPKYDPRGWFQWYCRYWMGRRTDDDIKQIARWKSFGARHTGSIKASKDYKRGDPTNRPIQRQALLQWSYNPFV